MNKFNILPCVFCRRYLIAQQQRTFERVEYARRTIRRCRKVTYLENLVELPPFEIWFAIAIAKKLETGEGVVEDVISINSPPSDLAIGYWSMCAFGNHLQVEKCKISFSNHRFKGSCHIWIGTSFHSNDQNPIVVLIVYVGWIEKTLELDYWRFQIVVLLCSWMVANYKGFVTNVKCDEYGFTLMNFEHLIPLLAQSFTFPMHIEQVFFSKDVGSRGN